MDLLAEYSDDEAEAEAERGKREAEIALVAAAGAGNTETEALDEEEEDEDEEEEVGALSIEEEVNEDEINSMLDASIPNEQSTDQVQETPTESSEVKTKESAKPVKAKFCPTEERLFLVEPEAAAESLRKKYTGNIIPEGWLKLSHQSGLHLYLHRETRTVCMSMPYYLGTAHVRHHQVPVEAIPCLAYRRALVDSGHKFTCSVECQTDDLPELPPLLFAPGQPVDSTGSTAEMPLVEAAEANQSESSCPVVNENDSLEEPELLQSNTLSPEKDINQDEIDREEGECSSDSEKEKTSSVVEAVSKSRKRRKKSCGDGSGIPKKVARGPNDAEESVTVGEGMKLTSVEVINMDDINKSSLLTPNDVTNYAKNLFQFKSVPVHKTKRILNFAAKRARKKNNQKPLFALSKSNQGQIIRCKGLNKDGIMTEFELKPHGKSLLHLLHEYCQRMKHNCPTYETKILNDSKAPYANTVVISGTVYATGRGASKKLAKQDAARKTLDVLLPELRDILANQETGQNVVRAGNTSSVQNTSQSQPDEAGNAARGAAASAADEVRDVNEDEGSTSKGGNQSQIEAPDSKDVEILDNILVTDPRLQDVLMRLNMPSPHWFLVECLNRHCIDEKEIQAEVVVRRKPSRNLFVMKLREMEVQVPCKNKRLGRQVAAQHMLSKFHPSVSTWGGIMRLYGPGSKPEVKQGLSEVQQLLTADKGQLKIGLIEQLRTKMKELAKEWRDHGPTFRGKFYVPPENLPCMDYHPDSLNDVYQDPTADP